MNYLEKYKIFSLLKEELSPETYKNAAHQLADTDPDTASEIMLRYVKDEKNQKNIYNLVGSGGKNQGLFELSFKNYIFFIKKDMGVNKVKHTDKPEDFNIGGALNNEVMFLVTPVFKKLMDSNGKVDNYDFYTYASNIRFRCVNYLSEMTSVIDYSVSMRRDGVDIPDYIRRELSSDSISSENYLMNRRQAKRFLDSYINNISFNEELDYLNEFLEDNIEVYEHIIDSYKKINKRDLLFGDKSTKKRISEGSFELYLDD